MGSLPRPIIASGEAVDLYVAAAAVVVVADVRTLLHGSEMSISTRASPNKGYVLQR